MSFEEKNMDCGLHNFGVTCYINAVIQCLNACPSIIEGITNAEEHETDLEYLQLINSCSEDKLESNKDLIDRNITIERIKYLNVYFHFKKLIIEMNKVKNKTIIPGDFIIACKKIADDNGMEHLFSGMQNDAQEFLSFLIDILHESKITSKEIPIKFKSVEECKDSHSDKIYFQAEQKFKEYYNNKNSWLLKELYFQNICITKCNKCPYYSLNFDPTNSLMVPIPNLKNKLQQITLIDCLDHHFGKEIFGKDCQWKCDECDNKEMNYKQYRIFNCPKTLIINIKRFEYDNNHNGYIKNNKLIEIPEILNMSNYKLFNKNENNTYKLFAIVNHIGNIEGGHYYSFCKNNIKTNIKKGTNEWYIYNDESISKLKGDLITSKTYMLFYELII